VEIIAVSSSGLPYSQRFSETNYTPKFLRPDAAFASGQEIKAAFNKELRLAKEKGFEDSDVVAALEGLQIRSAFAAASGDRDTWRDSPLISEEAWDEFLREGNIRFQADNHVALAKDMLKKNALTLIKGRIASLAKSPAGAPVTIYQDNTGTNHVAESDIVVNCLGPRSLSRSPGTLVENLIKSGQLTLNRSGSGFDTRYDGSSVANPALFVNGHLNRGSIACSGNDKVCFYNSRNGIYASQLYGAAMGQRVFNHARSRLGVPLNETYRLLEDLSPRLNSDDASVALGAYKNLLSQQGVHEHDFLPSLVSDAMLLVATSKPEWMVYDQPQWTDYGIRIMVAAENADAIRGEISKHFSTVIESGKEEGVASIRITGDRETLSAFIQKKPELIKAVTQSLASKNMDFVRSASTPAAEYDGHSTRFPRPGVSYSPLNR
jgi:hypothetical protein